MSTPEVEPTIPPVEIDETPTDLSIKKHEPSKALLQSALDQWDTVTELGKIAKRIMDGEMNEEVKERAKNAMEQLDKQHFTRTEEDDSEITAAVRLREVLSDLTTGEKPDED